MSWTVVPRDCEVHFKHLVDFPDLVARHDFHLADGATVADASGNGRTATIMRYDQLYLQGGFLDDLNGDIGAGKAATRRSQSFQLRRNGNTQRAGGSNLAIRLRKTGAPTGTATIRIGTDRTATGSFVEMTLDVATLTTSYVFRTFSPPSLAIAALTTYYITVEYAGGDAANFIEWSIANGGSIATGSRWFGDTSVGGASDYRLTFALQRTDPTYVAGIAPGSSYGIDCDGPTVALEYTGATGTYLRGLTSRTFEVVIKPNMRGTIGGSSTLLFTTHNFDASLGWDWYLDSTGRARLRHCTGSTSEEKASTRIVPLNAVSAVGFTYDDATKQVVFYINGEPEPAQTFSTVTSGFNGGDRARWLGDDSDGQNDGALDGVASEPRIWSRPLTPAEMKLRAERGANLYDTVQPQRVRWTETDDERMGEWGIQVANPRSRVAAKIEAGDEVEVWLRLDGEPSLSRRYVGVIGPTRTELGAGMMSDMDISGLHFEARLMDRHTTRTVPASKDLGALIHEVFEGNDLGITLGGVPNPYGATAGVKLAFDYVDLREFLVRVAGIAGAGWHVDANKVLHFYAKGTVDSGIVETGATGDGFSFMEDAESVVNVIRGFGGVSKVLRASQTAQTAVSRVTTSVELSTRVLWPADNVALFEVWAKAVSGSVAGLEVRIEGDDAGSPTGVALARILINASELSTTGAYHTGFFPKHIIGPGTFIHFIVKATSETGVDIGVDNAVDLNMTYRAYVGYPVASERKSQASINKYGKREGRPIRDGDVTNLEELNLRLDVHLAKFSEPAVVARWRARSAAYMTMPMGSYVTVQVPEARGNLANRQLIVTERAHEIANQQYRVSVSVSDGERQREAGNLLAALLRRVEFLEGAALRASSDILQLLTASDSMAAADTPATIATTASGTFDYGMANYGFADYA